MLFDHVSKPIAGRYFPYNASEIAHRVAGLTTYTAREPKPQRINVILKNTLIDCRYGHQLCTFLRCSYLASFSLPDLVAPPLARRAIDTVLDQFAHIDRQPCRWLRARNFLVYRAFLGAFGEVHITENAVNGQGIPWRHADTVLMLSKRSRNCDGQPVVFRTRLA